MNFPIGTLVYLPDGRLGRIFCDYDSWVGVALEPKADPEELRWFLKTDLPTLDSSPEDDGVPLG